MVDNGCAELQSQFKNENEKDSKQAGIHTLLMVLHLLRAC